MILIKNKKGWLRIAEAFLAIIIIMGVVFFIYSQTGKGSIEGHNILEIEKMILDVVVENSDFRTTILKSNPTHQELEAINNTIRGKLPSWLDFDVQYCKLSDVCATNENPDEIYVQERVVSSTLNQYGHSLYNEPMKIKLFVWQKVQEQ